jgi:NAD-dependent SIR2 family protein deacetylase
MDSVQESIVKLQQPPLCLYCNAKPSNKSKPVYVKPDIVFFGEQLPPVFHKTLPNDIKTADLCLVLGTSLQVPPTAHIPDMVQWTCRRVLLNRELVGNFKVKPGATSAGRDAFHAGDCDDSILRIARHLGWEQELFAKHELARKKAS